jgi:hypothetical protein
MGMLTADFLLERLAENGVRRIYGYPGDGINAIVVDSSHRAWGVDNLFVVDGSVMPTQGAANPALQARVDDRDCPYECVTRIGTVPMSRSHS